MSEKHLFSNTDIRKLLLPIMVEQLLASLMGMVDTIMVSNVGSAAISAVSLVDSINILVIQLFSALAAGGAILCSQYMGGKNIRQAETSANQVLLTVTVLSSLMTGVCLLFRRPLLSLIFGAVEPAVMTNSEVYFLYTALSFPFIAIYDAGASIFRAQNNTRCPMIILGRRHRRSRCRNLYLAVPDFLCGHGHVLAAPAMLCAARLQLPFHPATMELYPEDSLHRRSLRY